MLRQMVLALRVWRPDVIVTDAPADELTKAVNLVVRKAFEVAADAGHVPRADQGTRASAVGRPQTARRD